MSWRRKLPGAVVAAMITARLAADAPSAPPTPPAAAVRPVELREHSGTRVDNYFWLRERDNPEVRAYLEAENAYTEAMLADVKPLEETLYREMVGRIKDDDSSVPYDDNGYEYATRYAPGKEYPIYTRRQLAEGAAEEIVLDVNELAAGQPYCFVSEVLVNRQNDRAAFAVDFAGGRIYTLRLKDLGSGELLDDEIPEMTGNFVWAEDGRTLFYTRHDPVTLRSYQVYRHAIGTDPKDDVLVFEEADTTFGCIVSKSRSKKYLLIRSRQTLSDEWRYLDAMDPTGEFRVFVPRRRGHEHAIDHIGEHFYVRTNHEAVNFRLMRTADSSPGEETWQDVAPVRDEVLLERFELFDNYVVVQERRGGLSHVRIMPRDGSAEHEIALDETAYSVALAPTPEAANRVLRFNYTSLTTPQSTFDYDMQSRTKTLRKQKPVLGGFAAENYQTQRLMAPARDGTKVPITLVYRKGVQADGSHPCLVYGYGSYGYESEPEFSSELLSLLDRGFVYAIAHVRGGEMMGRSWYEDGRLLHKMNTFTDFIDCGEYIVGQRWADPKRMYAMGGSAGGLLMGAVINMRPDLFAGVFAVVPFVDVVTTMLDESLPLTTYEYDEWGDPRQETFYRYMLSYSPYDNVVAQDYPHLLVATSFHDSQVQYWEPAKWVAKLRATTTGDNLLLLKTNMDAGHGGASGRYERLKLTALAYSFFLRLAGISE